MSLKGEFYDDSPMFTYAAEEEASDPATLLFHGSKGTEETIATIANDPEYRQIMGELTSTVYADGANDIVATPYPNPVFRQMERAQEGETVIIVPPDNGMPAQKVNLYDTYYRCLKPHKLIVGCLDCMLEGPAVDDCELKNLYFAVPTKSKLQSYLGAGELKNWLRSKKSKIGGFTFVSPMLTAPGPFETTLRPPIRHDFSQVAYRSGIRARANKERGRINRFGKKECSRCLARQECQSRWGFRSIQKFCLGPYAMTQKEAVKKIVSSTAIPYTRKQLAYCINASGELERRVGRYKCYLGFNMEGKVLTFGLRRKCNPGHFTPLVPFKKVQEVVEQYCGHIREDRPVSDELLATLIELTHWNNSPVYNAAFHGYTKWPILSVVRNPPGDTLRVEFCRKGFHGGVWRPVDFSHLEDILDVYRRYKKFQTLEQEDSELGWRHSESRRYSW